MTYQENRSSNERFEQDIKDMRNHFIISDIIHDKLDKFWANTQKKLIKLDQSWQSVGTTRRPDRSDQTFVEPDPGRIMKRTVPVCAQVGIGKGHP